MFVIASGLFVSRSFWKAPETHSSSVHSSHELMSEETRLWGKASGPVQARIEFLEQNGNRVQLEGQIRSTLPQFKVQWKLPPGVRLVEGSLEETIQQPSEQATLHSRKLVVEVTWPLEKPHLVLRAAQNDSPDSLGASTVFNLDPSLIEMEKEEIIRAHMQSRRIQKLVK